MYLSAAAGVLLASTAIAHPFKNVARQSLPIDDVVLQFALTLEHLENAFYHDALLNFTQQDFIDAGYTATYYNNLQYISVDEQTHVQALTAAIKADGYAPVDACTYNFPYTDVPSFITLSSVLEGVGTSAYLGGAPLITRKDYLTVAGSILVTEALHTSYQRAAKGEVPMANPFGTPLDPTSVFTLAASFIVSCPSTNYVLPFTAFPALTYNVSASCTCEEPDCSPNAAESWGPYGAPNTNYRPSQTWESSAYPTPTTTPQSYCSPPTAGGSIQLTAASSIPAGSYVTFVNGLSVTSVQGTISGSDITVTIPSADQGQTYVFITNADVESTFSDAAVLFGPAIIEVEPPAPVVDDSIV